MVGERVETYRGEDLWLNRVGRGEPLPGAHRTREAAAEVGRAEARVRGVEHVIRRVDGTVTARNRYPRRSEEIPG